VSGERRPSKAVLTVCAEIEGDARDSIAILPADVLAEAVDSAIDKMAAKLEGGGR
jgi:hypothetical protein